MIFFTDAVKNLKISEYQSIIQGNYSRQLWNFRNHPRVTVIKSLNNGSRFNFCRVSVEHVVEESKKSTQKAT